MKRNESYLRVYLFSVFFLSLIFCSTTAFGATLYVPDEYETIQDAINAAFDGDTVLVADGTYTGEGNKNLNFNGKKITVRSENGPENCIIDSEGNGRGFYFEKGEGRDSVVSGFTITGGHVQNGGGGIFLNASSPTITNCIIRGNKAGWGGGIDIFRSSPSITNCTIEANSAERIGGGIYFYSSSPIITNCTISGNTAGLYGGGIYSGVSSPSITNCTISQNMAQLEGGGFYSYYSSSTITNSIFWGDTPDEISLATQSEAEVTYSDVKVPDTIYPGEGNINDDPIFVDPQSGDFHLSAGTACIDAGTSSGAPAYDIDGDSRPQGEGYDIGSDEYRDGDASQKSGTVSIGGCDTGVKDQIHSLKLSSELVSDSIEQCADDARNHGKFVSCVATLTNKLRKAGVITSKQKGAIKSCAAQADIP